MSGARFGGPKPASASLPVHYAIRGSVNGICGEQMAVRRTQRDSHISCERCLRVRIGMLGLAFADRALDRVSGLPSERFKVLRRALENGKRFVRWEVGRGSGKRRP